jgi:hypothetical protein
LPQNYHPLPQNYGGLPQNYHPLPQNYGGLPRISLALPGFTRSCRKATYAAALRIELRNSKLAAKNSL